MAWSCGYMRQLLLALAACAAFGCRASYVDRGAALYASHDYVEADELFEHNEPRLANASGAERARYGLYRGMTLLSLGDSKRARYWLDYATRWTQRDPDALSADERATLNRALETHASFEAKVATPQRAAEPSEAAITAAAQ
ncbi:MAG: hypothetical protein ACOY0T_28660 [Myxococcota bacterium]